MSSAVHNQSRVLERSEVLLQVARILESPAFNHAYSLNRFLRYVVEENLSGRGDSIKEYSLGVAVFGRGTDFDPKADTIVRVQARRLRTKLQQYYKERGQSDPVVIELPKGTYDPLISRSVGSGESGAASSEANVTPEAIVRSRPLRWQWAVAVTSVVAILGGVWWFERSGKQTSGRLVGMRQVTNSAAADLSPAFSPDGSQLAFTSNRTGHFEIYVRSLAPGATERQITFDGQDNRDPSWSPDGRQLAYAKQRGGIGLIAVTGGPTRYLSDSGDQPQWSPNGRMLVFRAFSPNPVFVTGSDADSTLMLAGVDGSPPRPLTHPSHPPGGHNNPKWLSDGRTVVFSTISDESSLTPGSITRSSKPWFVDTQTGRFHAIDRRTTMWNTRPLHRIAARFTFSGARHGLGCGGRVCARTGGPISPKR